MCTDIPSVVGVPWTSSAPAWWPHARWCTCSCRAATPRNFRTRSSSRPGSWARPSGSSSSRSRLIETGPSSSFFVSPSFTENSGLWILFAKIKKGFQFLVSTPWVFFAIVKSCQRVVEEAFCYRRWQDKEAVVHQHRPAAADHSLTHTSRRSKS